VVRGERAVRARVAAVRARVAAGKATAAGVRVAAGKATVAGARVGAALFAGLFAVGGGEGLFAVGGPRTRAAKAEAMAVLAAEESVPESSMRALLGTKGDGRGGR
jgi:hypothetical protein